MSPYEATSWEQWDNCAASKAQPVNELGELVDELLVANERLIVASIHEQELADRSRYESARLRGLLESIPDGVLVVSPLGEIILANPAARKMLGLGDRRSLSVQRDWAKIEMRSLDGRALAAIERPLIRALRGQTFADLEVIAWIPIVGERQLSFSSGVVRSQSGAVSQAILLIRDVTETRKVEQEREECLSLVSHDLRTPLTVILGRAELLAAMVAQDESRALEAEVAAILRSARRMQQILDDVLETSRLETGNFSLHLAPVDMASVVASVLSDVLSSPDRARVRLEVDADLPVILSDAVRVGRVIANLVTNALKFSERNAPVEVRIRRVTDELKVLVVDHGVGIPADDVPRIFDRYYQAKAGVKRAGQGLGLYLSRLIVQALGGEIGVTTTPGQGSIFCFSLPVR
jgi:signal transduction histidine kinase